MLFTDACIYIFAIIHAILSYLMRLTE